MQRNGLTTREPRWRTRATGLLAALVSALALTAALTVAVAPAATAATTPTIDVATVSSDNAPGADIEITVTVVAGIEATESDTAELRIHPLVVSSISQANQWLGGEVASWQWGGARIADSVEVPALAAGEAVTLTLTVPAAALTGPTFSGGSGFVPLVVTLAGSDAAANYLLAPWQLSGAVDATHVVVPIVAPPSSSALIPADELAQLTSVDGPLGRQLDSVRDLDVIIAIDPRITASIAETSDTHPARAWLSALAQHSTVIPLTFSDADIAALAEAGMTSLPAASDDGVAWSATDVAVPATATISDSSLALLAASGTTRVLIPSSIVGEDVTGGTVQGMTATVTDDDLTSALLATEADAGIDRLFVALALGTTTDSDQWMVLPRTWVMHTSAVRSGLLALAAADWVPISTALPSDSSDADDSPLTLTGQGRAALDVGLVRSLTDATASALDFAALTGADATDFALQLQREQLALTSLSWQAGLDNWRPAVDAQLSTLDSYANAVTVSGLAPITLVSGQSEIPVTIANDSVFAVDVGAAIDASNGKIVITNSTETVHIDPHSTATLHVPVRAVANGAVTLSIQLTSAAGAPIGAAVSRDMTVNAEWESWGVTATVIGVIALFGFGLIRGIHRNLIERRNRATENTSDRTAAAASEGER